MERSIFKIILVFLLIKMHYTLLIMERSVCTTIDANFSQFEVCEVRRNKANIPAFYMKLHLLQLPVTNCFLEAELQQMRQNNAVVLFKATWDACKLMENSRKFTSFKFFYNMFTKYSNINHSCPYTHDLMVNDLSTPKLFIPLLKGNYVLKTSYKMNGQKRLAVDFYAKEV